MVRNLHSTTGVFTACTHSHARGPDVSAVFGINVGRSHTTEYSSADLVQDFLYYSGDMKVEDAARIAGVSTATLGRWRMMGARQLRSDVRTRLEEYLSTRGTTDAAMQAA